MNDKYLELVQALLKAESGTESELLATHPELVDRQLVMTLLATAQWMTVRNDPEAASTIEWLNNFATQLATYLGIELESSTDEDNPQTQLDFFVEVLQEIERSNTDPKVIYPLFSANLHHLNSELIPIAAQVKEQLSESEEGKQEIASVLVSFSNLIQQFPLGNRAINLEVAIKLYELALSVYTRAAFPEDWAMTQMNRAVAYRNRIRGERAENLDKAIELYELALSVRTRAAFPNNGQ